MADVPPTSEQGPRAPQPIPDGFGVESDRWHLTCSEDGSLILLDSDNGTAIGVGSHNDLTELTNLLLIGTDVLDCTPVVENTLRVDFVMVPNGNGVVFSIFGQPPAVGEAVRLPDGVEATVLHVRRDYRRNGTSKVTVIVETVSAA